MTLTPEQQIEVVREKIKDYLKLNIREGDCNCQHHKGQRERIVTWLLSLPEIAILDNDQSLPKYSPYPCEPGHIQRAQDDMLSEHFQKTMDKTI